MKESLLEKLDKRLEETADIKKMINEQLKLYATNYLVNRKPDLYFNGQLTEVQSSLFREDETDIHLDLWLEMSAKISDEPIAFEVQSTPVFFWAEDKKDQKFSKN
jgi:thioredoxin-related protein